ncbi:MAG: hypothetical protein IOB84_01570 [Brevundimonas sp.]|nr:hypothetical protein [Brevundimonas sp.]
MTIDWNKPVQIRGTADDPSLHVRILCTDGPCEKYPVVGVFPNGVPARWGLDGRAETRFLAKNDKYQLDLVNAPEHPKMLKLWVNVYPEGNTGELASSRELADRWATPRRIACVEVNITYRPGEGLEGSAP